MVEYSSSSLSNTYAALSDGSRRAILARLLTGPARVTEIAEPFDLSLNAVSKHIRVLERAGLIRREVKGREHHLSIDPRPLAAAANWIEEQRSFWETRVDALESLLLAKRRTAAKSKSEKL